MTTPELIDGIYKVIRPLGSGAMSDVYLVQAPRGEVALKLLKPLTQLSQAEKILDAFKFEVSWQRYSDHPHVAKIFDFGFDENLQRFYFTQSLVQGSLLDVYCRHQTPQVVEELFGQCLQGLSFIHQHGVIHGDLKPSNILVTIQNKLPLIKIVDFGLADPRIQLMSGTPLYWPPEKIQKLVTVSMPSWDLYALGIIFYEILTGENPFRMGSLDKIFAAHLKIFPRPALEANPQIPEYLNEILMGLLKKNPHDRWSQASQVLEHLYLAQKKRRHLRAQITVTEKWIGRRDIYQQIDHWAYHDSDGKKLGIIEGPPGVGKKRLLDTLKLDWQLAGRKIVKDFVLTENSEEEVSNRGNSTDFKIWKLVPFTREDVSEFIFQSASRVPPDALVNFIYQKTGGHPGYTVTLFRQLAERYELMDQTGQWNLSLFKAGLPFGLLHEPEMGTIIQALQATSPSDWLGRGYLLSQKISLLIHKQQFREAGKELLCLKKLIKENALADGVSKLRVFYLEKKGWVTLIKNYPLRAKKFLMAGEKLAEKEGDAVSLLRIRNFLGRVFIQEGSLDQAVNLFQQTRAQVNKLPGQNRILVTNNDLGYAFFLLGRYHEALKTFDEDLTFFDRYELKSFRARVIWNKGECFYMLKNWDMALQCYHQATSVAQATKQHEILLRCYNSLGNIFQLTGDHEQAVDTYEWAMDLARYLHDDVAAASIAQNRAAILQGLNRQPEALRDLKLSLKFIDRTPDQSDYLRSLKSRAMAEIKSMSVTSRVASPSGDQLKRFLEVGKLLVSEKDKQKLLQQILRHACEFSGAESGLIILLGEKQRLEVAASLNLVVNQELDQISKNIAKRVLETGCYILTNNAGADPAFNQFASVIHLQIKSVLCLPIFYMNVMMGVIYLTNRYRHGAFNLDQIEVLQAFVDFAGLALQSAQDFFRLGEKNQELSDELTHSEEELSHYKIAAHQEGGKQFGLMVGSSAAMKKLFLLMERISDTPLSVLILGESGVGKELVARALHKNSRRRGKPFVSINCGAIPENLLESELFGHRTGAFTGANRDKKGLFEEADGGTIFLDEIGELKPHLQVKLLRVIQEREVMRLGETTPRRVDVRILSATLKNLDPTMAHGDFRQDLWYRLRELELVVPPLRERREDIPLLVNHFIKKYSREKKQRGMLQCGARLLKVFMRYSWPGNVRELENKVRVCLALSDGKYLRLEDMPMADQELLAQSWPDVPAGIQAGKSTAKPVVQAVEVFVDPLQKWQQAELAIIAKALLHFDFSISRTAHALGASQATIYNRLREYGLDKNREKWNKHSFKFVDGLTLPGCKKALFKRVLEIKKGRVYEAARILGVSPATFYKWKS